VSSDISLFPFIDRYVLTHFFRRIPIPTSPSPTDSRNTSPPSTPGLSEDDDDPHSSIHNSNVKLHKMACGICRHRENSDDRIYNHSIFRVMDLLIQIVLLRLHLGQ
jgi:hypothetical protein